MNEIFKLLNFIKTQVDIDCFKPVIKVVLINNSIQLKINAIVRDKIYLSERTFTEWEIEHGVIPHEIMFFCKQVKEDIVEQSKKEANG